MSNIIQSLWIGGSLGKMEQLSAKSFIDHGHTYHLYTYGKVENIPEGVIVKDGNEIVSKSEIFRYKNGSLSAFSNYFRFHMLHMKGGYWADTDLICTKPFQFKQDYVFISEPTRDYKNNIPTSCLIKMPKNSLVTAEAIKIQKEHKKLILSGRLTWSSGPKTVQMIIETFFLHRYILQYKTVCSCHYSHILSLLNPSYKPNPNIVNSINDIPEKMVAIHLWNEVWRRRGYDKNRTYHPDSLYEQLKRKHFKKKTSESLLNI